MLYINTFVNAIRGASLGPSEAPNLRNIPSYYGSGDIYYLNHFRHIDVT